MEERDVIKAQLIKTNQVSHILLIYSLLLSKRPFRIQSLLFKTVDAIPDNSR
jgi:hypothetical protein